MFGGQRRWMKSERIKIMSELWSLFPAPMNIAWTIPESLASVDWQAFFAQLLCPKSPVFSMFFLNKFLFFSSQLSTREFIFRCRSRSALTTSMTWTFKKNWCWRFILKENCNYVLPFDVAARLILKRIPGEMLQVFYERINYDAPDDYLYSRKYFSRSFFIIIDWSSPTVDIRNWVLILSEFLSFS